MLELEILRLEMVRAIIEGNFSSNVESIAALMPWMFALDHINYARWLSVHVRDMVTLQTTHPGVYQNFTNGAKRTLKDLWYCSMTGEASSVKLMRLDNSCSASVLTLWIGFLSSFGATSTPSIISRRSCLEPNTCDTARASKSC